MAAKRRSKRGASWTDEETECLLAIWGEKKIEMLLEDPKKHKGSVYTMIENEMAKNSHEKSGQQCKIRMHTLRKNYRDCNKKLKTSGNARKLCKFYPKLAELLGDRPATSPLKIVESMTRKRLQKEDVSEYSEDDEDPWRTHSDGVDANGDNNMNQDHDAAADNDDTFRPLDDSEDDTDVTDPAVKPNDDKITNEKKESGVVMKAEKKKRKTKLETVIGSLMSTFNDSNSKLEGTLVDLETKKADIEMKRLELEKQKLEYEERQRREERAMKREERQEERRHQFQMMNMILGRVNAVPTGNMFKSSNNFSGNHASTANPDSFQPNVSFDDGGRSFYDL